MTTYTPADHRPFLHGLCNLLKDESIYEKLVKALGDKGVRLLDSYFRTFNNETVVKPADEQLIKQSLVDMGYSPEEIQKKGEEMVQNNPGNKWDYKPKFKMLKKGTGIDWSATGTADKTHEMSWDNTPRVDVAHELRFTTEGKVDVKKNIN